MSASAWNPDWFTDPPWDRISLWWLQNYVNNVRNNPGILEAMQANRAEFETVPVPVAVIRHLASPSVDSRTLPEEPPLDRDPALDVVGSFAEALEARNLDAAMQHISSSYFDVLNRNRDQLKRDLDQLIEQTASIQIQPARVIGLESTGEQVLATLEVTWEAEGPSEEVSERRRHSRIELFLRPAHREGWKIESIRTV
jgi:hypothetical protein